MGLYFNNIDKRTSRSWMLSFWQLVFRFNYIHQNKESLFPMLKLKEIDTNLSRCHLTGKRSNQNFNFRVFKIWHISMSASNCQQVNAFPIFNKSIKLSLFLFGSTNSLVNALISYYIFFWEIHLLLRNIHIHIYLQITNNFPYFRTAFVLYCFPELKNKIFLHFLFNKLIHIKFLKKFHQHLLGRRPTLLTSIMQMLYNFRFYLFKM